MWYVLGRVLGWMKELMLVGVDAAVECVWVLKRRSPKLPVQG